MVSHLFRIICIVGLVVVLGLAVIGQFWAVGLVAPQNEIFMVSEGVWIEHNAAQGWGTWHHSVMSWKLSGLLKTPSFSSVLDGTGIFLPWWLIFCGWGLITLLVWRKTRHRNANLGFPIESTGKQM